MKNNLISSNPDALKKEAFNYKSWQVTERQICDLELLLNGAFAPLTGFMDEADYQSVLKDLRLKDGSLWPMPITLDVDEAFSKELTNGDKITLRDHEGFALAVLTISDIYQPDFKAEAQAAYGTTDKTHPAVNYLYNQSKAVYVGG